MRQLLLLVLIGLGVWLLMRAVRRANRPAGPRRPAATDTTPMQRCAHCGVFIPRPDVVERHGLPYCSPEHARLGRR